MAKTRADKRNENMRERIIARDKDRRWQWDAHLGWFKDTGKAYVAFTPTHASAGHKVVFGSGSRGTIVSRQSIEVSKEFKNWQGHKYLGVETIPVVAIRKQFSREVVMARVDDLEQIGFRTFKAKKLMVY